MCLYLFKAAISASLFLGLTQAVACTPPLRPSGWKEPSFAESVDAAYKVAGMVVMVEVTRVEKVVPNPKEPLVGIETAFVQPLKFFKGETKNMPEFFQTRFLGHSCDKPSLLLIGTRQILFVASNGTISFRVGTQNPSLYQEALEKLERYPPQPEP